MATSSAKPEGMASFLQQVTPDATNLGTAVNAAATSTNDFEALPCDPQFRVAGLGDGVTGAGQWTNEIVGDDNFVATVRNAFVQADSTTLPDGVIASALASAGISPASQPPVTVNDPAYNGAPMMSGWSDDPVCTATGHFFEVEEDLVVPEPLKVLRWARSYSSRHIVDGSHGPGWSSWATTRIDPAGGQVWRFWGPDGRRADLVAADGSDEVHVSGVEGTFRVPSPGAGWELRWRWTSPWPGMTWRFAPDGALASIHDPFGGTTICERGDDGRLLGLAHEGGRALRLVWDGERIARLESSDGRTVRYRYQGGFLVGVERPDGGRRYTVDAAGRVTEVWDADGVRLVANDYDAQGRVTSQTSPTGRVSSYTYLAPHTVTVTDEAGGPATVFRHDRLGRLVELRIGDGRRSTRTFDDAGNPVHVRELDGGETSRRFDVDGNLVWQEGPDGSIEEWSHDHAGRVTRHLGPGGAVTEIAYEGDEAWPAVVRGFGGDERRFTSRNGLPLSAVDADGVSYAAERDADGSIVAITDGEGGRTTFGVHPSGATSWTLTPTGERTTYDLDDAGRCLTVTGPSGARGEAAWSSAGRLLSLTVGQDTERFGWDPAGLLASITDPAGATTALERDLLGDVTDVTLANGGRWQLDHDQGGQLAALTDPSGATWRFAGDRVTDPAGGVTEAAAEPGRLAVQTPTGQRSTGEISPDGRREVTRWATGAERVVERDQAGRVVRASIGADTTTWSYTAAGRVASIGDGRGRSWSLRYDRAGRLVEVAGPEGITALRRDAAGRPVEVTTPAGVRRRMTYSPDGQPAQLTESADGGPEVVTRLEWDGAGRLLRLVQPDGGVEGGAWDAAGRLTATTDSLGATTRLERDRAGQVIGVEDAAGARWSYDRDLLGRPTAVTDPIGRTTALEWSPLGQIQRLAAGPVDRRFAFDPDGRLVGIDDGHDGTDLLRVTHDGDGRGLTARAPSAAGMVRWDEQGRVTRHGPEGRPTEVAWDDDDLAVTIVPAAGRPTRYRCDADGRVVSVEHPTAGTVTVERDAEGRVLLVAGAGVARRWRRDGRGRPVRYEETRGGVTSATELSWDARSRLVSSTTDGRTTRYVYDLAGQLVGMSAPDGDRRWSYDACGRLVAETGPEGTTTHHYDAASQLLQTVRADGVEVRYAYDVLGRRTDEAASDGTSASYEWDGLGRLVAIHRTDPDGTTRSTRLDVGPLGDLTAVDGTPVDWWPVDVMGRAPAAIGGRDVLAVDGHPVASVGPDGDIEWLSADWSGALGSPTDPWGPAPVPSTGPGLWRSELVVGGLVWLHNRVYDPATRQWLSRDDRAGELTHPGALANPYQYAANDPVNHRDPDGRRPVTAAQANQQIKSWSTPQWGKIATVAEVVGGVALCFTPLAPIGAGMLIGVGSSIGTQYLFTGKVDWNQVAISGAAGGVAGGVGAAVGGSEVVANLAANAGRFAPVVTGAISGGAGGASGGLTQSLLSGQPPTVQGLVTDTVIGGATGGILHGPEPGSDSETFFRTMSKDNLGQLQTTGRVPATAETFVSPSGEYAARYGGVTVKFSVQPGTTDALSSIGVRDTSALTRAAYPDMPPVKPGWTSTSAFFKGERGVVNIGLGHGPALDIFNKAIQQWEVMP